MASKNRILEPYGYRDQNWFYTPQSLVSQDLASIKKVNDDQTNEISSLQHSTVSLDSFIQFVSGTTLSLEEVRRVIAEEIVNRIGADDALNERIDGIMSGGSLSELAEALELETEARIASDNDILSSVTSNFESINEELDTVTDEIDSIHEKLTELEQADSAFTDSIASLSDALSAESEARVNADQELTDAYQRLAEEVALLSGDTTDIDAMKQQMQVISGQQENINSTIISMSSNLGVCLQKTADNERQLKELKDLIGSTDITSLSAIVATVEAHSVMISGLTEEQEETSQALQELQTLAEGKADKSELTQYAKQSDLDIVSGDVVVLEAKVDAISGDVQTIRFDVAEAKETANNAAYVADTALDNLAQEILDRQSGDAELLGSELDDSTKITIYGTRKLISVSNTNTLNSANSYTDNQINYIVEDFEQSINALRDEIYGKLNDYVTWSGLSNNYASKEYVDESSAQALVDAKTYAQEQDNEIQIALHNELGTIESAVTRNTNSINHITTYDFNGSSEEYDDSGNGVLDVLHREFHDLKIRTSGITGSSIWATDDPELQGEIKDADTKISKIKIKKDGTFWLIVEDQWVCLNEVLMGLVGETY